MIPRNPRGFTLLEVLVVIGVVAILAAILFPVVQQARERAAQGVCLTHMHNLGDALAQYSYDNDGKYVKAYYGFPDDCASWGSTYYDWRYAIKPYIDDVESFACPQNTVEKNWDYWTGTMNSFGQNSHFLPTSYAANQSVIGFANGECVGLSSGLDSRSQISSPSHTILLADSRTGWITAETYFIGTKLSDVQNTNSWSYQGGVPPVYPADDGNFMNHNGFVHFLMADGHSRSMKLSASIVPTNQWDSGESPDQLQGYLSTMPDEYK